MDLILVVGPQAVGKMTVGLELEKLIDAELLFNHQTIDLFARFLGYTSETFQLSEKVRLDLFKAFTSNEKTNTTRGIIFTVVAGFDLDNDWKVMENWIELFKHAQGRVYFIELEADLEERMKRNIHEDRLSAKSSKRDIPFSRNELLESSRSHRLNSYEREVEKRLPFVNYLRINNTSLKASDTAKEIYEWMKSVGY